MKTKPASLAAFFHPRFLLSFAFCSAGVLLALAAVALYPGATARAQEPPAKHSAAPPLLLAPLGGPTTAGQLIISEFRQRGPSGANDEFIELYNTTFGDLSVLSADGSPGLAVVASDGVPRCIVPNGTVIEIGGHFLCTNSVSYSLSSYPSGSGSTATGDRTYTLEVPDSGGLAIFNNSTGGASFSVANRIDAVGTTTVAALYREGAGLPVLQPFSIDYSWVRRLPGGCITGLNCGTVPLLLNTSGPSSSQPQDTNNNANDFIFSDTNATSAGGGQRLGAPGPQNLAGPGAVDRLPSQGAETRVLDPCALETSPPNFIRDATSVPGQNSTFGTIEIRKTFFAKNIGAPITRLRYRVVDITTYPTFNGMADLRPLTSSDVSATVDRSPCGSGFSNVTVHGTTLEEPPSQPNDGGYNSSLSVEAVTPATPVQIDSSIDVRFLLGVEHNGVGRFCVVAETEPTTAAQVSCFTPIDTTPATAPSCGTTIFSEDFEGVELPHLPQGWVSTFANGPADCTPSGTCAFGTHWQPGQSFEVSDTPFTFVFHDDPACVTDSTLDTTTIPITDSGAQLTFRNYYNTEAGYDGGVLEISSPNISGGAFTDILAAGGSFVSGGYNQAISSNFHSPIAGRQAWSGKSVGYITTTVNLPAAVLFQTIRLRFRMASDCSIAGPEGWSIDTVKVTAGVCEAQALNISTRMQVQTGNNVLIGGFIVTGNTTKKVALRGIGPSLAGSGIPDPLADPTLELHNSSGALIAQNDNWQDDPAQATQLTNLGIAPTDPNESGMVVTLQPSAGYTAILAGKNGGTGVGLVEVYDVNAATGSQLANISTRGPVQTGSNVMIGGFILGGSGNSRVIVRGLGPSLGVNPVLADPTLELHDGNGATLIANDNWQDDPASAAQLTAFGLALPNPNESGIFFFLPPGNFTAIVAGKNGGTGIGLVEVYNIN